MISRVLLAVDPGQSGGIAVALDGDTVSAYPMPETVQDIVELLREIAGTASNCEAYMEIVQGYIGERQPGSAAFKFGQGYGALLAALAAFRVRTVLVHPKKWQAGLSLGSSGRTQVPPGASKEEKKRIESQNSQAKAEWKRKLREKAQQLFPQVKVTLAVADALLILEFAKRQTSLRELAGEVNP